MSIYVTLAIAGILPSWLAIVVVSRDLMILSAVLLSWVMHRPVEIKPLLVSKLNTAAQIGFAAFDPVHESLRRRSSRVRRRGDDRGRDLDRRLRRGLSRGLAAPHGRLSARSGSSEVDDDAPAAVIFWLVALVVAGPVAPVLRDILLPFVAGFALAYMLDPLADRLQRVGLGRSAPALSS